MENLESTAVIFDLGNVLVSFDHERCYQALALMLGISTEPVREIVENRIRPRFDRGKMTIDEVHSTLEASFGGSLDKKGFLHVWADVFVPIPEMIEWLQSLHGRVRLALLSNTDAIHLPWVKEEFGFLHHFEHLILSYEVGATKPDSAIYRAALDRLSLPATSCCFIDDIEDYTQAAQGLGMTAVHHRSPSETRRLVEEWLESRGRV